MIRLLFRLLPLIVFVPMAVLMWYLAYEMSNRYAATAQVRVKMNEPSAPISGLGSALGVSVSGGEEDENLLLAYINSPDLLNALEAELNLFEHYSDESIDWYSRLSDDASREDFLEYYRERVTVERDGTTNLLVIEVQTFNRTLAEALMREVLARSEDFVNDINQQLAQRQLEFAQEDLQRAQEQLRISKDALLRFQNENRVFSPQGQSEALSSVINSLESQLIQAETQLNEYQSYLNDDAPQLVATRARINALREEIERQRSRMVGDSSNRQQMNELNADYQALELELEFATNNYTSMLSAFEAARTEATRRLRNLVVVSSPQRPDEARYPDRIYWILTWLLGAVLVYFTLRLILSIVREHQD